MFLLSTVAALSATGIVAGLLAGLLGVGGGIVIVPVLFFGFQLLGVPAAIAMPVATGTSLACIIPTSLSSMLAHYRRNNIDLELLRRWGPFVVLGAVSGSFLAARVNGLWLTGLFGGLAVFTALNMLLRSDARPLRQALPGEMAQRLMGGTIGTLSVMVGVGGGSLTVPTLTACNYPPHRAVGTSTVIGLLISLPGALMMLLSGVTVADAPAGTVGLVNLLGLICIVPLTITFAPLGARLGQHLPPRRLKQIFAVCLLLTGLRMLLALI